MNNIQNEIKSNLTPEDEYKPSFVHLIHKNNKNINRNYNPNYQNKKIRKKIITKTIKPMCNYLEFSEKTFYKTVGLLDSLSSKYLFDNKTFQKVALICMSFASKTQEIQKKALLINALDMIIENPDEDYQNLEKQLLICLNFNVNIITPQDYISELLDMEIVYKGIKCNVRKKFRKSVLRLTYHTCLEYETNQFTSLAVALSIISTNRKLFGCDDNLPQSLQTQTNYSKDILKLSYNSITRISMKLIKKFSKINKSFSSDSTQTTSSEIEIE